MKNFLIFLVFKSTILYQVSGAPKHFLVETEDDQEEPRIDDYEGKFEDYQASDECKLKKSGEMKEVDAGEEVILISGGAGRGTSRKCEACKSVEVFSPDYQCVLPSLPENRQQHTMDNATLCGGEGTLTSCLTFSSGKWVTSHAMAQKRSDHTSWNNKEEGKIILMGGDRRQETETITKGKIDGVPGFRMKYYTRDACSITDHTTNSVIITGGSYERTVSRYNTSGHVEDLPSLIRGRKQHGCGSYRDDSGEQVFLVAGGIGVTSHGSSSSTDGSISSTEMLTRTKCVWVTVNPLPKKMYGLRGVTLGGVLYMTGGNREVEGASGFHEFSSSIYKWTGQNWERVGKMKNARVYHAVSTIRLDEIKDYCT